MRSICMVWVVVGVFFFFNSGRPRKLIGLSAYPPRPHETNRVARILTASCWSMASSTPPPSLSLGRIIRGQSLTISHGEMLIDPKGAAAPSNGVFLLSIATPCHTEGVPDARDNNASRANLSRTLLHRLRPNTSGIRAAHSYVGVCPLIVSRH